MIGYFAVSSGSNVETISVSRTPVGLLDLCPGNNIGMQEGHNLRKTKIKPSSCLLLIPRTPASQSLSLCFLIAEQNANIILEGVGINPTGKQWLAVSMVKVRGHMLSPLVPLPLHHRTVLRDFRSLLCPLV